MNLNFLMLQNFLKEGRQITGEVYFENETLPSYNYLRTLEVIPGGLLIRGVYRGLHSLRGAETEYILEFYKHEIKSLYQSRYLSRTSPLVTNKSSEASLKNNYLYLGDKPISLRRPTFFPNNLPSYIAALIRQNIKTPPFEVDVVDIDKKSLETTLISLEKKENYFEALVENHKFGGKMQFSKQDLTLLSWKGLMGPLQFKNNQWQSGQGELRFKISLNDSESVE